LSRFYVTTPIFYVNGDPHLGTAYAATCADAFARWHRLVGDEVFFLTGTDEHGLKIQQTAAAHGVSPQAWVDETAERFRQAWAELELSYDDFIRTTEPRHHEAVQAFLGIIYERGYLYKDVYSGFYCVSCEAYFDESELLEGHRCPIHKREVSEMSEENYFFRLSAFEEELRRLYDDGRIVVHPESRRHEIEGLLEQGLKDISVTRTSVSWGVQVPWDPAHVFYVWYDALVNYLTAIGYGKDEARFAAWWPYVHHLLGKDIIRFHGVWWPAMCLAAGIEPPGHLLVTGWLLSGGEKMSKSLGNQISPLEVTRSLSADALRYYLLQATGFGADGDVSREQLVAVYNGDLANDLGNLVSRTLALVVSKLGGRAPAAPSPVGELAPLPRLVEEAAAAWSEFRPQAALAAAMEMVRAANALLERVEPWRRQGSDPEVGWVLGASREVLRLVALLLSPAIPRAAEMILGHLGHGGHRVLVWTEGGDGTELVRQPPVFPRVEAR
jgi:methionyl-tRNA synthetase